MEHIEYLDELHLLKTELEHLITNDDKSAILQWLEEHKHLSTNDLAQIVGKSAYYIRRLRRDLGVSTNKAYKKRPVSNNIKNINTILVPDDWDNSDWLAKVVNVYSISAIAKACGVSRRTILRKIKKYDIKRLAKPLIKNHFCTWNWCHRHYTELGWSQAKCAKKAGICQQTFANWLNYFKIPVRTSSESINQNFNIKLWIKELQYKLKEVPIVNKVFLRKDHIHVRFKDYFWESYYFEPTLDKLPPYSYYISNQDARIHEIPKVYPEYEADIYNGSYCENGIINQPHILLNRSDIAKSSFIEVRLAIHEFCRQITQRAWSRPLHPERILAKELSEIKKASWNKHINQNSLRVFTNNKPSLGRKIMESYFDIDEYASIFKSPKYTIKLLNHLLTRKDMKFNYHNLLRLYTAGVVRTPMQYQNYKMYDPSVYIALFNLLKIKDSVLDPHPGFGSKAIAASVSGLKYYTLTDTNFEKASQRGFCNFLNLDYGVWNNHQIDLILLDNNFNLPDVKIISEFLKYSNRLVIFVPHHKKHSYYSKLSPKSMIKIKTKWYQKVPDYLFIW